MNMISDGNSNKVFKNFLIVGVIIKLKLNNYNSNSNVNPYVHVNEAILLEGKVSLELTTAVSLL